MSCLSFEDARGEGLTGVAYRAVRRRHRIMTLLAARGAVNVAEVQHAAQGTAWRVGDAAIRADFRRLRTDGLVQPHQGGGVELTEAGWRWCDGRGL